jgi:hypothetical protein
VVGGCCWGGGGGDCWMRVVPSMQACAGAPPAHKQPLVRRVTRSHTSRTRTSTRTRTCDHGAQCRCKAAHREHELQAVDLIPVSLCDMCATECVCWRHSVSVCAVCMTSTPKQAHPKHVPLPFQCAACTQHTPAEQAKRGSWATRHTHSLNQHAASPRHTHTHPAHTLLTHTRTHTHTCAHTHTHARAHTHTHTHTRTPPRAEADANGLLQVARALQQPLRLALRGRRTLQVVLKQVLHLAWPAALCERVV